MTPLQITAEHCKSVIKDALERRAPKPGVGREAWQRELAQSLGVDLKSVENWMSGNNCPGMVGIMKLFSHFEDSFADEVCGQTAGVHVGLHHSVASRRLHQLTADVASALEQCKNGSGR